nr:DNA-directed DNA polymerase [Tanacetum cinerariifolium]
MADNRTMEELLQAPTEGFEETFGEAWERFKEMLRACVHHEFTELTQIDTFNNGLNENDQDSLNVVAGGNLLRKTTRVALNIIENKSKVRYLRYKPNVSRMNMNSRENASKTDDRIDKLVDQISTLVDIVSKKVVTPATIKAVEESCKKLSLPELTPTKMTLELADRSITHPKGVVEDVFIKVRKFHFPTDFVVVDFEADPRVPLILGKSFLRTGHALIDVYGEEITLRVNDEAVTFNLNQTTRYSSTYNDMSVNQIDVIDVAREEYAQEMLGFSKNSLGGNPTSTSEPIISDSSPSLTPFGGSDFILEEIEAYLKDESTSPEIDHADCDWEGDICLIEKLLNNDPFQLPLMDLKEGEEKCHFMVTEGIILGHKISKNILEVDRAKVDVIAILPHPTTVKGVRSFLGHAGFYRRFIQDFSKIAKPMTHLLEKETSFVFSKDCIDAFETLKKKLIEAPILVVPDWNIPFELMCDASDFAIGAVLEQRKRKHFQPIHYASKTMIEAQNHYTTTKKEMLAVVYAFEKFWPYLVLSKSIVYTDHSALKYLLNKQDAKPRLIRWVLLLQEFNIIIRDKKGTENLAADHLSRLENPQKDVFKNKDINKKFPLDTLGNISSRSTPWFFDFAIYHARNFIVKGMSSQQKKKIFKDGIDFMGLFLSSRGNRYILVAVDYLSKWVEANSLPTNDARVVVKILKSLFARFRTPRAIISDLEVSNRGLKRILERTVGENRASWSEKLEDALWAFRTSYKTPIGCTLYKLVYEKSCHLPIELEHKAYWALKHANFDLKTAGDHRKLQLNELNELHDQAYENSLIYKEKTKKLHDSKIKNRIFNVGDQVLLFNSHLKILSRKLKTRWSGPFTITQVFPYRTIELSQPEGPNFKVNGHRVKHYFGGDIPQLVVLDLQTFPMDN